MHEINRRLNKTGDDQNTMKYQINGVALNFLLVIIMSLKTKTYSHGANKRTRTFHFLQFCLTFLPNKLEKVGQKCTNFWCHIFAK